MSYWLKLHWSEFLSAVISSLSHNLNQEGLRGDKISKTVLSVGLKFLGFHFLSTVNNFPNLHSSGATIAVVIDYLSLETLIS